MVRRALAISEAVDSVEQVVGVLSAFGLFLVHDFLRVAYLLLLLFLFVAFFLCDLSVIVSVLIVIIVIIVWKRMSGMIFINLNLTRVWVFGLVVRIGHFALSICAA